MGTLERSEQSNLICGRTVTKNYTSPNFSDARPCRRASVALKKQRKPEAEPVRSGTAAWTG